MVEWTGVEGRRCIVTGATSGIGKAAATELAMLGAEVTVVGRDRARAEAVAAEISTAIGRPVDIALADLASQHAVRSLAAELLSRYPQIHVLINNAGVINQKRTLTVDGIESTLAVNHLAPFLLTALLMERLQASAPARVVTVASDAAKGSRIDFDDIGHERDYRGMRVYGQSKLANILFTHELARRLEGTGVTATCMHPGVVGTGWGKNDSGLLKLGLTLGRPFLRSPRKGAETVVWLASAPEVQGESGGFYFDRQRRNPPEPIDDAAARGLWEVSLELCGLAQGAAAR
jgi:retinol dehydrogenase-14